ncbi:glycosyltransferase [Erwinia sp. E_sp_B01_3]|uniref:glycosyltransferase n=1 Tax=unclassified Erwinia TaxID=2622719 RepID=UPI0030D182AA
MSHYAIIAPPLYSHQRALEALAYELMALGHRITFIQQPEALANLQEPGIGRHPVGILSHPEGSLSRTLKLAASPGLSLLSLIEDMALTTDMLCAELPAALEKLAVDGLIVDQMEPAGGLVAEALGLPFVSVACALPVNREPGLPLPVMPFDYGTDQRSLRLFKSSQRIYDWLMRAQNRAINRHAAAFGLRSRKGLHDCLSPLLQISQTLPGLDFPRYALPETFHAVGPLRKPRHHLQPHPGVSSSRPLVFASLGTLQGHRFSQFKSIARACRSLDVQLLIAHCGGLDEAQSDLLRENGATWVTDFADQYAVLQQAQAVVTHGGMNTVADAIATLTPVLAMPVAFDQPGVAARVSWSGIGRRVSRNCSSDTLAKNLHPLLSENRYQQHLQPLQAQLNNAGGAVLAARLISQALSPSFSVIAKAAG